MSCAELLKQTGLSDKQIRGKAFSHLFVTGFGSISPLLITGVIFLLIKSPIHFGAFIENGEAGICAVAVLLGAFVLIARELKTPFICRVIFLTVALGLWVIAIILYTCVRIDGVKDIGIDPLWLAWLSVLVWGLSLLLSVIVVLIDANREVIDANTVEQERQNQFSSLQHDFNEEADDE